MLLKLVIRGEFLQACLTTTFPLKEFFYEKPQVRMTVLVSSRFFVSESSQGVVVVRHITWTCVTTSPGAQHHCRHREP